MIRLLSILSALRMFFSLVSRSSLCRAGISHPQYRNVVTAPEQLPASFLTPLCKAQAAAQSGKTFWRAACAVVL